MDSKQLPQLPLDEWEQTKITLHLFAQIVGKVRLALMPPRNHWWHVPLYVSSRGITTRPIPCNGIVFEIELDVIEHQLVVSTSRGERSATPLAGLGVAGFHNTLMNTLASFGITVSILAQPYDMPFTTPFAQDTGHSTYQAEYVRRFWEILVWVDTVFWEFGGGFVGKTTPIHLFWHSFDLVITRFSGRTAPPIEGANRVAREAYSHEVISFGFWAGDANVREPAFYAYAWPEPAGLRDMPLPAPARWVEQRGSSMALLSYEAVRASQDPRACLLGFLESAYQAGATLAGWDPALTPGR